MAEASTSALVASHEQYHHRRSLGAGSSADKEVSRRLQISRRQRGEWTDLVHNRQSTLPKTSEPLTYDVGLLAVFDPSPLDVAFYQEDREECLRAGAREGVQGLINALWELPTSVDADGVMARLPEITTVLPREKPLPKAKEQTKWEKFAKGKGIAPKAKRDRKVFDEEKQDHVARWGYKGKNKDAEQQWLVEVPASKDSDFNPRTAAKEERKERSLKNKAQQMRNVTRGQASSQSSGKKRRSH